MDDLTLSALYRAYQPELVQSLNRRFPWSRELVEDAVQVAFLRLQGADPVPDEPRAWLRTVARRDVIDRLREQGRIVSDEAAIAGHPGEPANMGTSSSQSRPSPTLVQRALLLLTTRAQRLLKGKYQDDKTYGTLAREEGLAKSSMGRLLDRARERLRRAVRGMPPGS